jgi:hypothetical protein
MSLKQTCLFESVQVDLICLEYSNRVLISITDSGSFGSLVMFYQWLMSRFILISRIRTDLDISTTRKSTRRSYLFGEKFVWAIRRTCACVCQELSRETSHKAFVEKTNFAKCRLKKRTLEKRRVV